MEEGKEMVEAKKNKEEKHLEGKRALTPKLKTWTEGKKLNLAMKILSKKVCTHWGHLRETDFDTKTEGIDGSGETIFLNTEPLTDTLGGIIQPRARCYVEPCQRNLHKHVSN